MAIITLVILAIFSTSKYVRNFCVVTEIYQHSLEILIFLDSLVKNEHFLRVGNLVIGRGNEKQRHLMRDVLMQIPKNRLILNGLNDMVYSKADLDARAARIRGMAIPLSTSIAQREYRRLYPCCLTKDDTIWNFG